MSRLIDADELLKALNSFNDKENGNEHFLCGIETAKELIENQPTAYDIDKVVEQLEDVGQKMSESKSIQKYGKSSPANHRYYKAVSVKRAIGIVKGGGVDE